MKDMKGEKQTETLDATVEVSGQLARVEAGIDGLHAVLEALGGNMAGTKDDLDKIRQQVEGAAKELSDTLEAVKTPLATWGKWAFLFLSIGAFCMFAGTAALVTLAWAVVGG